MKPIFIDMRKYLLVFSFFLLLPSVSVKGQSTMTDEQVLKMVASEYQKGTSQSQIITQLIQQGVDIQQIRRVRKKYESQINNQGLGSVADKAITGAESRMRINNGKSSDVPTTLKEEQQNVYSNNLIQTDMRQKSDYRRNSRGYNLYEQELKSMLPADTATLYLQLLDEQEKNRKKVFGRDIFNNEDLTFEPSMNIATPQDYRLGPGDAVNIDIYGASQKSFAATVSPDGDIIIEGIGPVQVSGLSIAQANARLRARLGTRYSSSNVKLTLGQTRTITVNVMGEVVVPGTYTLSAFASVFHALYMAGGISDIGTLRDIKVYRNNRLVSTVDIYDYILNGKLTGNIRLADGDVISVGAYDCLVNITGKVKRPMYYEMKRNESVGTLVKYAGGFAGDAYRKSIRLIRKTGRDYSVFNVGEFEMNSFQLADGDSLGVDSILQRYSNMVEIKGAVFRPGMYKIGSTIQSVRTLIEQAEGLKEDAFRARAVMHRMKEDRTLEVISIDVDGILKGTSADIPLKENDVLYIPSNMLINDSYTMTIHGEVQYPGVYRYADNETLEDFILQAGGLTDAASTVKVDVARRVVNPKAFMNDSVISQTFTFALKDGFVVDGKQGFILKPFDEVYVRKSPGYSEQKNVYLEGNVMFAGTYTLSHKNERLSQIINKAGGLNDRAYPQGARIERVRTIEEQIRDKTLLQMMASQSGDTIDVNKLQLGTTYTVGIELDKALAHPGGDEDLVLREGDRIIIPEYNGTVKVSGDVLYPNTVSYQKGKKLSYYVEQAGGWGNRAKKGQTYIIYMNGMVAKVKHNTKILPGSQIVVPTKMKKDGKSLTQWLSIGTSTASIATMFATIANLLK